MSSPRLNDTIIVGCITMYISVFLFGLDGNLVSPGNYSVNCQVRENEKFNYRVWRDEPLGCRILTS